MEVKGKVSRRSIMPMVAAVVLIVAAAILIGWFAGEALLDYMSADGTGQSTAPDSEEDTEGSAPAAAGQELQDAGSDAGDEPATAISLPELSDYENDAGQADSTSPFSSPPWAANLSITPVDDGGGEQASATEVASESSREPSVGSEPLLSPEVAEGEDVIISSAAGGAGQDGTSAPPPGSEEGAGTGASAAESAAKTIYRVRVGPFDSKEQAAADSERLSKLGYPTMIGNDGKYYVQIGAFSIRSNADSLAKKAQAEGYRAYVTD